MNKYQQILTKYWGYTNFRPLQLEIIESIDKNIDTLGLMPTGGGKSVTFQVPAMLKAGVCLVITPLVALMRDQVERLNKLKIKAMAIYSGMMFQEIANCFDHCAYGDVKFLYCSPERIETELFKHRILKINVSMIVVDEAHCISQWGYDFRPSYLRIAELRELLPHAPVLALTATATPEVVKDIQEKLRFKRSNVLRSPFERKNLSYIVREVEDKRRYLLRTLAKNKSSGIIYARTRNTTRDLAEFLTKNNIPAEYFHAGLDHQVKADRQKRWTTGKTKIIVATNAFGMGIDKPDVRFVIHYDIPDSIEEYFQEAGRAGRDGEPAAGVLLVNDASTHDMLERVKTKYPEISSILNVYQALGNYFQIPVSAGKGQSYEFNIADFAARYSMSILNVYNCLRILQDEGLIELTETIENPTRIIFNVSRDDLYKFQVANFQFDEFIKLILRMYSGLFVNYCKINEEEIAKKAGITTDTVYQYLSRLSQQRIITYLPRKQSPFIIYTTERLEQKNIHISTEKYFRLKENYISRLNAMLMYASSSSVCRSQILLSYFGERDTERCGQCDMCKRKNELNLSKYEYNRLTDDIRQILLIQPLPLDTLIDKLNHDKDKIIRTIQWLLDNNYINYNDKNELTWINL